MALYYLETSALVKLYIIEPGTARLLRLAAENEENRLAILALSPIEVRSAIRRRERAGDIDSKSANLILDRLRRHAETRFLTQPMSQAILDGALEIIDRYALRAYDAIQVAGCLALKGPSSAGAPVFVCADRQLLDAARSELLAVLDPCITS
ncbi:MAG TPA: type II toxin-antitoxin system VapC family toxin [Candidatus Acidoferrales bacterium]|nr:type II toxin-antitoxin system VapC family toxin [Candidatus Acidoferrales bacterium]